MGAGETKTLDIGVANATEMVVGVQNQVEGTNIYVEEVQTPSAPSPEGKVYSCFSVETENVSDNDLSSLTIKFEVDRSWVLQNDIDSSTITLSRYHGGKWRELPTGETDRDAATIYYSAESQGFSTFVITGEETRPGFPYWQLAALIAVIVIVVIVGVLVWRRRALSKEWLSAERRPSEVEKIKKEWEAPEEEEAEGELRRKRLRKKKPGGVRRQRKKKSRSKRKNGRKSAPLFVKVVSRCVHADYERSEFFYL